MSSIETYEQGAVDKHNSEKTRQDQSQSLSVHHDLTAESFTIAEDTQSEVEIHDEAQNTWNETSDDDKETLIGKKRQRTEFTETFGGKRAKTGATDEIECFQKDEIKGHLRRKPGQIAGTKFARVLKQGQQIAHWLDAVCLPQTDFCRSYNNSALSFECKNAHKFFLRID